MSSLDHIPPPLPPSLPSPPPTGPHKRRVTRVAPLQLGKICALLYGAMGLIFIPIFLLMGVAAAAAPEAAQFGFAMGAGFALFAPIMYAVMGFLTGVVGAAIYNLVAKWVGGIEVEVA